MPDVGSGPKSNHRIKLVMYGYPLYADPLTIGAKASCADGMENEDPWLRRGAEVQVMQGREVVDTVRLNGGVWRRQQCTFTLDVRTNDSSTAPSFYIAEGDASYPLSHQAASEGPSFLFVR